MILGTGDSFFNVAYDNCAIHKYPYYAAAFPSVPTLQSPGDGSTITDDTPTLEWSASSGATQYQVQVDNNPDFSSPVVDTTGPGTAYTVASGLNDDTYFWRVRAGDSIRSWSSSTPPWQFTVDTGVPPVPIIVVSGVCETNLPPNSNTVELLQISNIGDGLLTYNLSKFPTAGWLWEDPTSDSLSGGESDNVDLHF